MNLYNKLLQLVIIASFIFGNGDLFSGRSDRDSDRPNLYYKNRYEPLTPYPPRHYPNWYGSEPEAYKYRNPNSATYEDKNKHTGVEPRGNYYKR